MLGSSDIFKISIHILDLNIIDNDLNTSEKEKKKNNLFNTIKSILQIPIQTVEITEAQINFSQQKRDIEKIFLLSHMIKVEKIRGKHITAKIPLEVKEIKIKNKPSITNTFIKLNTKIERKKISFDNLLIKNKSFSGNSNLYITQKKIIIL